MVRRSLLNMRSDCRVRSRWDFNLSRKSVKVSKQSIEDRVEALTQRLRIAADPLCDLS
jgi:hypothetical protein